MPNETDEKLVKLIPVAKEILKRVADHDVLIGNITEDEKKEAYKSFSSEMIDYFVKEELTAYDVEMVFKLAMQAYDSLANVTMNSINLAYELAIKELFGKDKIDVTLKDLNSILKK